MSGHLYFLQEREFKNSNEDVYKLGKTKQEFGKRTASYPKNSVVYLQVFVDNVDERENIAIKYFKQNFTHREDIGNEYFEGDKYEMESAIYKISRSLDVNEVLADERLKKFTHQLKELKNLNVLTLEQQITKIKDKNKKKEEEKQKKEEEEQKKEEEKQKKEEEKQKKEEEKQRKLHFQNIVKKIRPKMIEIFKNKINEYNEYKENMEYIKNDKAFLVFVNENIMRTDEPKDRIKKTEIVCYFKGWFQESQGGRKMPKSEELYVFMDKKFGAYRKNGWHGIKFIYPEDDDVDEL
jgi:hypothetical protein